MEWSLHPSQNWKKKALADMSFEYCTKDTHRLDKIRLDKLVCHKIASIARKFVL